MQFIGAGVGRRRAAATSAIGRKRTLKTAIFQALERPLSGKGDIQNDANETPLANDRFTLQSGH